MSEGVEFQPPDLESDGAKNVRIVAVGASAGGLAALRTFFGDVPDDLDAAFVVVQHLDPTHATMLSELLQQVTSLTVSEVVDGEPVRSGHLYVMPPGVVVHLEGGRLHLTDRSPTNAGRSPIDLFFRSLAEAQNTEAIGIVMSGTGSDGTLGLAALQAVGAVTMAQQPENAEFEGMPRSAITAGVVDVVADITELARIVGEQCQQQGATDSAMVVGASALAEVIGLVREHSGHDYSGYKPGTLRRRLDRRMALHQIVAVSDYLRLLRDDPNEIDRLGRDLLIGVTSFFRDPAVWRAISNDVITAMIEGHDPNAELRAWVPACSTGEEAYSLAMSYLEVADRLSAVGGRRVPTLRIFATDVEPSAIDRARHGLYPTDVRDDVGEERFTRWFTQVGTQVRVSQRIRDMVVFAVHDLLSDPPFTRLHLLTCRNLLIYLEPPMQLRVLTTLHHSLEPDGTLVLGMAEGTGEAADLFAPVSESLRIFRPRGTGTTRPPVSFRPVPAVARNLVRPTGGESRLELQVLRALVRQYSPAAVLTDERGDLLYVSGRTAGFLEAPSGRVNWNLLALVPEHIRWTLGQALREVVETGEPTALSGLRFERSNGRLRFDVRLRPLDGIEAEAQRVLVVFEPHVDAITAAAVLDVVDADVGEILAGEALAQELARMHQELQAAYSELHAASEQQASMNEEMQTANEQLQSTNEELMVSMEEVQSMNEELQTLNQELQARLDELMSASDDMGNLLNSTEIATVFLDAQLNVRRFTPHATSVINLREVDVGRPVSDIATALRYPELVPDAMEVMRTGASRDADVSTTDGRWFTVRSMPYRTHDDRLDGVVITFNDITAAKALEAQLRAINDASSAEASHDV
jgi:two-component system, chemotaxis family, CheB/CheR fusion protein